MITLFALAVLPLIAGGKQPQLAADGNTVALAYSDGTMLYAAVSANGGESFAAPRTIAGAADRRMAVSIGVRPRW